ncbi:MAG: phospholipase D-like domain-containing protein [Actinomycetota bacterium]
MPRLKTVALATTAAAAIAIAPAGAMAAKSKTPPLQGATTGVSMFIEPDTGHTPVVNFINSAKKTLDFGIYQLNDPVILAALVQAKQRGVKVRVMATWQTFAACSSTDPTSNLYNENTPILAQLAAQGIKTGWLLKSMISARPFLV